MKTEDQDVAAALLEAYIKKEQVKKEEEDPSTPLMDELEVLDEWHHEGTSIWGEEPIYPPISVSSTDSPTPRKNVFTKWIDQEDLDYLNED